MFRLDMTTEKWEVLPQNAVPGIECSFTQRTVFAPFGDGIMMIPNKYAGVQAGQVWWKATSQWSAMAPLPFWLFPHHVTAEPIWTGKRFLIADLVYEDPKVGTADGGGISWAPASWPMTYDPYANSFGYTTSIGFAKHARHTMAWTASAAEVFAFGGANGVAVETLHKEGYRIPLPQQ
jgi:hypothetical protein